MIFTVLKNILIDLGMDESALHDTTHLRKDLELDSTETVEISLELKRQLGVDIKLTSREDPTLAEICTMVERAKAGSAS